MVNAHEKCPEGVFLKAAYSHIRQGRIFDRICEGAAHPKARPASAREERGDGDASSGDRSGANRGEKKGRESSNIGGEHGSASKRDDRESSHGRSDRESRRSERRTAIEVEPDEKEVDRRKMAEIQSRIKARKAAKNLDLARATIADLKPAKKSSTTATEKTATKKVPDQDKTEGEKRARTSRGTKKATASQSITGSADTEPVASAVAVPHNPTPKSTANQEPTVGADPYRGRVNRRAGAKRRGDDALATLKFSAIADAGLHLTEPTEDVSNTKLGIALVASALGRKVPRISADLTVASMTKCYVGLAPTRKKSKAPAAVAPPNSVDSDDVERGDTESEVRLSQSDVHIGFPGDVGETTTDTGVVSLITETAIGDSSPVHEYPRINPEIATADPRRDAEVRSVALAARKDGATVFGSGMSDVAANEEVSDAPSAPGKIMTPVSELADTTGKTSETPESYQTPLTTAVIPGSAEEKAIWKVKFDNKQKMIRVIAASQLLQEELAKTDPNLVRVASFLNKVYGTDRGAQLLKEMADLLVRKGMTEIDDRDHGAGSERDRKGSCGSYRGICRVRIFQKIFPKNETRNLPETLPYLRRPASGVVVTFQQS